MVHKFEVEDRQSRSLFAIVIRAKVMATFHDHHLEPGVVSNEKTAWGYTVQIYIL